MSSAALCRRLGAVAAAGSLVLVAPTAAHARYAAPAATPDCAPPAASTPRVKRPTNGGTYAFNAPARQYASSRTVVHYVMRGPDAPPAADQDRDGVPDYVEQIGAAADQAFAFFERPHWAGRPLPGFETGFCDTAGPSPNLDIYVKDIAPFGQAIAPGRGEGGAFLLVRPRLERPRVGGGLRFTVAHELFHVVQFNYVPGGMPQWIAEGTANAMTFLFEGVDHRSLVQNVDRWYRAPWRPLYDKRDNCDRCYGGIFWWSVLQIQHRLLPAVFSELRESAGAGQPLGLGIRELERAFTAYYHADPALRAFAPGALYLEFRTGADALLQIRYSPESRPPPNMYELAARASHRNVRKSLNGLAAHYVPIAVPAGATGIEVSVTGPAAGKHPHAQLALGFRPGGRPAPFSRLLWPRARLVGSTPVWSTVIATNFRSARERQGVRLIVSSSASTPVSYRVRYRVCTGRPCPESAFQAEP